MFLLDLDPNVVKPGWTPLLITLGIAIAMVFLFLSMRRQFRRIDVSRFDAVGADPVVENESADGGGEGASRAPVDGPVLRGAGSDVVVVDDPTSTPSPR